MKTFSALLILCEGNPPVNDWFPSQRLVTQNFYVFVDLRLNIRTDSKQSKRRIPYDVNVIAFLASAVSIDNLLPHLRMQWWARWTVLFAWHYKDVIMSAVASQITSLTIVHSTVYSRRRSNNQNSASLAFVRGIHRWPVNFPHKGPVMRKMFPFHDDAMDPAIVRIIWIYAAENRFAFT